jgi:hypothetical protein
MEVFYDTEKVISESASNKQRPTYTIMDITDITTMDIIAATMHTTMDIDIFMLARL